MKHASWLGLVLLLGALLILFSPPPVSFANSEFVPGELLVRYKANVARNLNARANATELGTGDVTLDALNRTLGVQKIAPLFHAERNTPMPRALARIFKIEIADDQDVLAAAAQYAQDPNVEFAEPNYLARAIVTPNDPEFAQQWGLTKISAPTAWDTTTGNASVTIALIDSGLDKTHADLSSKLWMNPGEVAGNGIDDDANGYVDDVNGWNFVAGNNDPTDDNGHGTLVAGIAGADTNNGVGIAGVCWQCKLMPVKVMSAGGVANYSDVAAGVVYAAQKGARVINISLGGSADSQTLHAAIQSAANDYNAMVVAGAGNDNSSANFYPAAYSEVLAVAGTDESDVRVATSNYGAWVDVSAPGQNIRTTASGGGYATSSGTSLAAPFAAGLAGLLRSQNESWSQALVRAQIVNTTDNIDGANPSYVGQLGSGRINAASAMGSPQPKLTLNGFTVNGTADGRPDPGTTASLQVSVTNAWLDATNVSGTLSTTDGQVTINNATQSFGNIASGATAQNNTAFSLVIGAVGYNHAIPLTLHLTADGGYSDDISFLVNTSNGTTTENGVIASDTTWDTDKVHIVSGNILVSPGVRLTILPGTIIKFGGFYRLEVRGELLAIGTPTNPIIFTSNLSTPTPASWNGIFFQDQSVDAVVDGNGDYVSGSTIQYADISYGGSVISVYSSPYIAHDHIHDGTPTNPAGAGYSGGTSMVMFDHAGTAYLTDSLIENNIGGEGAVKISDGTQGNVLRNIIRNNTNGGWASGIWCANSSGSVIRDNQIINNTNGGISGGIFLYSGSHIITHNLIANNSSSQGSGSDRGGDAIGKWGAGAVITNNTIVGNTGFATLYFQFTNSGDRVENNNIILDPSRETYSVYLYPGHNGATSDVAATMNYWGTTDGNTINQAVYDFYDDFSLGKVITSPILTQPETNAPSFIQQLTLTPPSPVGIQQTTFTLTFSAPMNQNIAPIVTFGATQPYTTFSVTDNAQWLNDTTWRATYDITSLVPRGTYTTSVSGAVGLDGMEIPTDTRFSFVVDYAGGITDQTPPTKPNVTDDGAFTSSTSQLHATWSSTDAESAITQYQYAIGTMPGATDVVNWKTPNPATATNVTKTGLNLTTGQKYYFSVKARNEGGLWSEVGVSDGIVADPNFVALGKPKLKSPTNKALVTKAKVKLDWNDAVGATSYHVIVKQGSKNGKTVVDTTVTGSQYKTPRLKKGQTYYWQVQACNGYGCFAWSKWWNFKVQ